MKILIIVNGPAYGSDVTFNALRLAVALAKHDGVEPRLFLMGDGVTAAVADQKTPDGYYKLDRMLITFAHQGGVIDCCTTCLDARGLAKEYLIEAAHPSTMDELARLTVEADKVLTF